MARKITLPRFKIKAEHIVPELKQILQKNRRDIKKLLAQKTKFTWNNLMQPLEDLSDKLHNMWIVVSHLNAVMNNKKLRDAHNACLPLLSAYATGLGHNKNLYNAIKSLSTGKEYKKLDFAQKKIMVNSLRDFKLSGIALPAKQKKQFAKLEAKLANLTSKFADNLLDATQGWHKLITNKKELSGIPELAIKTAKGNAKQKKLKGWLFTLEQPSYLAVMTYADLRKLREEMYSAYVTRASDQGANAGRWDNSKIMAEILKYRKDQAKLLKFANYAEYSLVPKMAKNSKQVLNFLNKLAKYSLVKANQEFNELKKFCKIDDLQLWDIAYYSEKLRQHKYAITQEELRPYFPEPRVINGMFQLFKRLYGITIKEIKNIPTWHPDVKTFELYDNNNILRSIFYLDLYSRPNKQGGAWMNDFQTRRRLTTGEMQIPIAFIDCNFNPPIEKNPALLTHNDVVTLFHEFGHSLQHMLTKIDYADVSGINGVPWDAVELASQFMENWCWQKPVINLISKHYKTGKPLPEKKFKRLLKAKNFQSGLAMLRQLEFALFDLHLHLEFDERKKNQIQKILDEVRSKVSILPQVEFNRFQHGFAHIFAGSYAAGYYSYKWAEVLSADAFAKFEEDGLFNKKTGQAFLHNILEMGGAVDPMILFKKFRGRPPKIDALLQHSGITQ